MQKVYIAGKISGDPGYKQKFARASLALRERWPEAVLINPAVLPDGMTPGDYMAVCLPMLLQADLVVFLPDWQDSGGARIEHALAEYAGKNIYEWEAQG